MDFKVEPYEWQRKALEMSESLNHLAILADMGTGKTGGAINVLRTKYNKHKKVMKTLIISPVVTLFNWKREFQIHSSIDDGRVHVLHGTGAKKISQFKKAIEINPHQVIIMNYESCIIKELAKVIKEWGPEIVVLDEAHYIKNHKAQRSKVILELSSSAYYKYILTGTPILNNPTDIFMPFLFLDNGETFGKVFYTFQRKYMRDENANWSHMQKYFPKWVTNKAMLPELQEKIYGKGIRVMKSECMDLPPLVEEVYEVDMSPKQKKIYDDMLRDFVAYVKKGKEEGAAVAQTAMTKALRLQQIASGYVTLDDGADLFIEDNPKLDALEELITALHANHKVIVWCSFRANYIQIGKLLEKLKIKHVFITGDQNASQKDEAMQDFSDDEDVRVCVANRRAGGIGINLVSADYSIVFSRNFSLGEELQSNDRNYRGGSQVHTKITRIQLVTKGTIEEEVTRALMGKKEVSEIILNLAK